MAVAVRNGSDISVLYEAKSPKSLDRTVGMRMQWGRGGTVVEAGEVQVTSGESFELHHAKDRICYRLRIVQLLHRTPLRCK